MRCESMKKPSQHYFHQVYDVVSLIPRGRVTTYGTIADFLCLGSARMVGWALNQSHGIDPPIPAHRVVNRVGELTGRLMFGAPDRMQHLLEAEGIEVVDDRVVRFEELWWHPEELLEDDIAD